MITEENKDNILEKQREFYQKVINKTPNDNTPKTKETVNAEKKIDTLNELLKK